MHNVYAHNLPPLVLKVRHPSGLALPFLLVLDLPERAMGWLPLRLGIDSKRYCKPTEFLFNNVDISLVNTHTHTLTHR